MGNNDKEKNIITFGDFTTNGGSGGFRGSAV